MMKSVKPSQWILTLSCLSALTLLGFAPGTAHAQAVPTTVTTTAALNPAPVDQSDPITVTVAGSNPTGTVTFYDESASPAATLGTLTLSNGTALYYLSMAYLGAGSHFLVASYNGDANNSPSSSAGFTQVINTPGTTPSSLSVDSSLNPAEYGKTVTLTAHVSPTAATGTVTFFYEDTGVGIGVAPVASGKATIDLPNVGVSNHPIHAVYSSDATYADSTFLLNQTVCLCPTAETLTSSKNPANSGDTVTLKATLNKTLATGSVDFYDSTDGTDYGAVAVSGGKAELVTSLPDGGHYIVAQYSGDNNYATSMSAIFQIVGTAFGPLTPTSTTITSSLNPALTTDTETFTATVNSTSATGYLNFTSSAGQPSQNVPIVNGTASATFAGLPNISLVQASYSGDSNYASSGAAITEVINPNATKVTLKSSLNPAAYGVPVTLTATLTGVNPQGIVYFSDILTGSNYETFASGNTVSCDLSNIYQYTPGVGTHSIIVQYSGDQNNTGGDSAVLNQIVILAPSTVSLTSSASPSYTSEPVTFYANITPLNATGYVTFTDTTTGSNLGQGYVENGSASVTASYLAAGSHVITAQYSGDENYAGKTATRTQVVKLNPTTTTLGSSVNPSTPNALVTLTATVDSVYATGTVTFTDTTTGTQLAVVPLENGTAAYSTSNLAVGSHVITALYSGDSNYAASTGSRTQVVKLIATTLSLQSSSDPATSGSYVTFTATVNSPVASGTVTFTDTTTGTTLGVVSVYGGIADLEYQTFATGSHVITATYSGDGTYAASSKTLTETVN